jgi:hypothetical protein
MNRKVNAPVALVAFAALAGLVYFIFTWAFRPPPANYNPGLADIPPRVPGHDKPVPPPKDAGPVPGAMAR